MATKTITLPADAGRVPRETRKFIIQELAGDRVRFEWDSQTQSSPRNSWPFGIKQRTNRIDYSGADEPTEQILGPNLKPFTVSGIWDDRYMGQGEAFATQQRIEQLAARGNLCRFQFEELSVNGIITDVDFNYVRKNYIGYSITVSPHLRVDGVGLGREQLPKNPKPELSPEKLFDDVKVQIALLADIHDTSDAEIERIALKGNALSNAIDKATRFIAKADEGARILETQIFGTIGEVNSSTARLLQTMQSIRADATDLLFDFATTTTTTELAFDQAIDILNFEAWMRDLSAQARLIVNSSDAAQKELSARMDGDIKAIYRPRAGENLYSVSNNFYGTPFEWRTILNANPEVPFDFDGTEFLIIPNIH